MTAIYLWSEGHNICGGTMYFHDIDFQVPFIAVGFVS